MAKAFDLSALDAHFAGTLANASGAAAVAPLASFEEDPDNPRFEEDALEFDLLVADVRERGILQPVVVRRLGSGKLRIRFGARRYRAAVKLGLATIPYVLTEDARQFDDYAQVSENQQRSSMQPLELAVFAAKKIASGEKKHLVAERLGMHASALTYLLCLTGDVLPFILELYHTNKCRSPRYLYQLRGFWEAAPQVVERACAAAGEVDLRLIESLAAEVKDYQAHGAPSQCAVAEGGRAVAESPAADEAPARSRKVGKRGRAAGVLSGLPAARGSLERRRGWPQVFGVHLGRNVAIEIFAPTSREELVRLRFLDTGEVAEAQATTITLVRVSHGGQDAGGALG